MPDFDLNINQVRSAFPQFVQISPLPVGGQKVVYRVEDENRNIRVLKIIEQDRGARDQRTIREILAAGKLEAACFARIFEANYCQVNNSECIYIIEEYIDGHPLSTILAHQGPLQSSIVKQVGATLLEALIHIEKANLVHRDIKPGNIMVGRDGRIVLIDLGIARHLDQKSVTSSFALFGPMTVGYCAPEQIRNEKRQISIRTDLFAVAIVIYEMVTGENPFCIGCRSAQEVIDRCLRYSPLKLSDRGFPEDLSNFVDICMSKAAHRRIADARTALEYFQNINWEI